MESSRIPSPQELFHSDDRSDKKKKHLPYEKPIPGYRTVKVFSKGLVIAIVILTLVITNMSLFHLQFYAMQSSSMERVIPKGSLVVCQIIDGTAEEQRDDEGTALREIEPGKILTYRNSEGMLITHEVVAKRENEDGRLQFELKGTENQKPDKKWVNEDQVVGKYLFHIPYLGYVFRF